MKKLIFLCVISLNCFSQEIVKLNEKNIYGCYKQISNSKYDFTILVSRKNIFKTSNSDSNTILMMSKYSPLRGMGTFSMAPLLLEGTTFFKDSKDNWEPNLAEDTFFTAKGNLEAFSMQFKKNTSKLQAIFSQFEKGEIELECTTDKSFIEDLHYKLLMD